MDSGGGPSAGWYPDPYELHRHRYWSGTEWTDHISDELAGGDGRFEQWPVPYGAPLVLGAPTDASMAADADQQPRAGRLRVVATAVVGVVVVVGLLLWLVPGGDDSTTVAELASGDLFTCAMTTGGAVTCWGDAAGGRLGPNAATQSSGPANVVSDATAISAGGSRACALRSGGVVSCWGNGDLALESTAVTGATAVAAATDHVCVLASGTVSCWGSNGSGQVDPKGPARVGRPTRVPGIDHARSIAVGLGFSCAIVPQGQVLCWGDDRKGQLGNPGLPHDQHGPIVVAGITGVERLTASDGHACAAAASLVACWGQNDRGQAGAGSSAPVTPTAGVVGLRQASALASSEWTTCALTQRHTVTCWGDDTFGQLGDGSASDPHLQPVVVESISGAIGVSAGSFHTCAWFRTGSVRCWGGNSYGQLGNGGRSDEVRPVPARLN